MPDMLSRPEEDFVRAQRVARMATADARADGRKVKGSDQRWWLGHGVGRFGG